jgi:hypothetical protein
MNERMRMKNETLIKRNDPRVTRQIEKMANSFARSRGTNRATKIIVADEPMRPVSTDMGVSRRVFPRLILLDHYHAESRTGIRASMAALKMYWSTYHYVATKCHVMVADADAIYSNDNH